MIMNLNTLNLIYLDTRLKCTKCTCLSRVTIVLKNSNAGESFTSTSEKNTPRPKCPAFFADCFAKARSEWIRTLFLNIRNVTFATFGSSVSINLESTTFTSTMEWNYRTRLSPFSCLFCKATYSKIELLRLHTRSCHSFNCGDCCVVIENWADFMSHSKNCEYAQENISFHKKERFKKLIREAKKKL